MAERIIIRGGTLDPHVHFRQPGATHKKEDFTTFATGVVLLQEAMKTLWLKRC